MTKTIFIFMILLFSSFGLFAQEQAEEEAPVQTFPQLRSEDCYKPAMIQQQKNEYYLHYTCRVDYIEGYMFDASVRFIGRYPVGLNGIDEIPETTKTSEHNRNECLSAVKRGLSVNIDRYAFGVTMDSGRRIFCYKNAIQNWER